MTQAFQPINPQNCSLKLHASHSPKDVITNETNNNSTGIKQHVHSAADPQPGNTTTSDDITEEICLQLIEKLDIYLLNNLVELFNLGIVNCYFSLKLIHLKNCLQQIGDRITSNISAPPLKKTKLDKGVIMKSEYESSIAEMISQLEILHSVIVEIVSIFTNIDVDSYVSRQRQSKFPELSLKSTNSSHSSVHSIQPHIYTPYLVENDYFRTNAVFIAEAIGCLADNDSHDLHNLISKMRDFNSQHSMVTHEFTNLQTDKAENGELLEAYTKEKNKCNEKLHNRKLFN
ncbi:hypothetical protein DASC09_022070 [Saccharomycopsis crataegensis]|uniref:Uncharacterized protein n=1 Tax=Saccharomycopsis crataegensis TaxID=43959 RepID=A0AAV5QJZ5_9ASCO|nr:hypothetical protein DASC09_022070 [Saccharomycopsis crataegensis]